MDVSVNKASLRREVETLYFLSEESHSCLQHKKEGKSASLVSRIARKDSRISDFKKAERLIDKAGDVSSRQQMSFVLDALTLYQKYGESEIVAALLCKRNDSWHATDSIGAKAYRLSFAPRMSSIMSWLLYETEAVDMLTLEEVARLRNQCGDSTWLSGADYRLAVSLHQQCESDSSKSSKLYSLFVISFFNKSLCYIDAGDIEVARDNLYKAYDLACDISDEERRRDSYVSIISLLAYVEARTGSDSAYELVEQAYALLSSPVLCKHYSPWAKHNLPVYLAQALQECGMHSEAF